MLFSNTRMLEVGKKWAEHPSVKKTISTGDKLRLSVLLENAASTSMPPNDGIEIFYRDYKILLTERIWSNLVCKKMIGIQPSFDGSIINYFIKRQPLAYDPIIDSMSCKLNKEKLKTLLSLESVNDLKNTHNLDGINEYVSVISNEIAHEIDRKVIDKISQNCGTDVQWDFATALGDTIKEKYESLYIRLVETGNVIYRKCSGGAANFIYTSPEIASIFEVSCSGWGPIGHDYKDNKNIQYVGTINNKWRLYKDPLLPVHEMILGYSGDSVYDNGLVFSPKNLFEIGRKNKDNPSKWDLCADFGLNFIPSGENYFAKINVKNFIC